MYTGMLALAAGLMTLRFLPVLPSVGWLLLTFLAGIFQWLLGMLNILARVVFAKNKHG